MPGFQIEARAAGRYEEFVAPLMAPFVTALLDEARLAPGDRVLDLACGTGFAARAAATRVGDGGTVVGVDVNAAMVTQARSVGGGSAVWSQGLAGALAIGSSSMDAIVCQQGMQFFADLPSALADAGRTLRPGGRLVATVWAPMERSVFMAAQHAAVADGLGPDASTSFRAALACTGDRLAEAFAGAGLAAVSVSEVVARPRLEDFATWARGQLAALPWGAALERARPDGIARTVAAMVRDLADHIDDAGCFEADLVSAMVAGTRQG